MKQRHNKLSAFLLRQNRLPQPCRAQLEGIKGISGSPDRKAVQTRHDSRREPQRCSRFGQNLEPSTGLWLDPRLQRGLWEPGADEWGTQEAKRLQTQGAFGGA